MCRGEGDRSAPGQGEQHSAGQRRAFGRIGSASDFIQQNESLVIGVIQNLPQYCDVSAESRETRGNRLPVADVGKDAARSEEHTSELQSLRHLVCRLLLEK